MKNYFPDSELKCKCGKCEFKFSQGTRDKLNALRHTLGFAMPVNSGYRCEAYNDLKGYTQTHATGQAVDISVTHARAYKLLQYAAAYGFTGIGIRQHSNSRFIHLDDLPEKLPKRPRPHVWSYR
jgi:uncharacterized protein YcbK (DUF882 family)